MLGVEKTATEAQIKKAYKKLALKFHPDKNRAPDAEDAFKLIATACDVLTDEEKREDYDRYGSEDGPQMGGGGGGGFHGGGMRRGYHPQEVSPEEIFNMFFGGGMRPGG